MNPTNQKVKFRIEDNYPGFGEFYSDCKDSIYRKFVTVWEEMLESGDKKAELVISACVDDHEFETTFNISAENLGLLTEVICKYFEEIEDYETCSKIMKICLAVQSQGI